MEPLGPPVVPADRIVSVLGKADRITPVGGGLDLVQRWALPEQNRFVVRQGHFGAALGLVRDPAPLLRLKALLQS